MFAIYTVTNDTIHGYITVILLEYITHVDFFNKYLLLFNITYYFTQFYIGLILSIYYTTKFTKINFNYKFAYMLGYLK